MWAIMIVSIIALLAGIFDAISGDEIKINRIHLPGYFEISGKDYMYGINSISMGIRAFCPSDTHIMPELENGPIAIFRKSARYVGFSYFGCQGVFIFKHHNRGFGFSRCFYTQRKIVLVSDYRMCSNYYWSLRCKPI